MKKAIIFILILGYGFIFSLPILAAPLDCKVPTGDKTGFDPRYSGDEMCLSIAIGGIDRINIKDNPLFKYLKIWYGFVIGAVGILTTVMVMWGGFKWLTSRGNSSTIGEAKEIIWGSIIGLFLCLLSYTILELINPKLLSINLNPSGNIKNVDCKTADGKDCNTASSSGSDTSGSGAAAATATATATTATAISTLTSSTATAAEKSTAWKSLQSGSPASMSTQQISTWKEIDLDQQASTFAALSRIDTNETTDINKIKYGISHISSYQYTVLKPNENQRAIMNYLMNPKLK